MRPRTGRQTPTSSRASELFPEPLGPMMPRPLPALQRKADVLHDDLVAAGRHHAGVFHHQAQ